MRIIQPGFQLVSDEGCEILEKFVDFESKLLIVITHIIDKSKWQHAPYDGSIVLTKQYIIDIDKMKILSEDEWKRYFSYEPYETFSDDGKLKMITQRLHEPVSNTDSISEEVIEVLSNDVVSESHGVAFTANKRESLLESIERREGEEVQRQKDTDAKLSLDAYFEQQLFRLKSGDLLLNFYSKENTFSLIFINDVFNLKISKPLPKDHEKWIKIKYKNYKTFHSLNLFWEFIIQDDKWYQTYMPFEITGKNSKISVMAKFVIQSTNKIRLSQNFTFDEYETIGDWDGFVWSDEFKPTEYKQLCFCCHVEVSFDPRYPKKICSACACKKVIDEHGHELYFSNIGIAGGLCVTYIEKAIEIKEDITQSKKLCYIKGKQYIATEARFGGIVIQKTDE